MPEPRFAQARQVQGLKRLAALGAAIFSLVAAAPAAAIAPSPTIRNFEDQVDRSILDVYSGTDISFSDGDACGFVLGAGGNFAPAYLGSICPTLRITFTSPQASVSLYGLPGDPPTSGTEDPTLIALGLDSQGREVASATVTPPEGTWRPIVLNTAAGDPPTILTVTITSARFGFGVDDIAYSPATQPDTEILTGPEGTVATGDGSFNWAGNQGVTGFRCSLDGEAPKACTRPFAFAGLANGQHTFTVGMTDRYGTRDATPATRTWTVAIPPPPARTRTVTVCPIPRTTVPSPLTGTRPMRTATGSGTRAESSRHPPPRWPARPRT